MGQKINPNGFRLGTHGRQWMGRWFAPKGRYQQYIHEDIRLRQFVKKYLAHAMVAKVDIERTASRIRVYIHTAKPGIVIGRKGAEVNDLRKKLKDIVSARPNQQEKEKDIDILIHEIKNPASDAQLVADSIGAQLLKRVAFRRAMRKAMQDAKKAGVQGIKIHVAGRLGGAEIARSEWVRDGRVPLHTLRADIDYGLSHIFTTYGALGVKVWIFTKEILPQGKELTQGGIRDSIKTMEAVKVDEQR